MKLGIVGIGLAGAAAVGTLLYRRYQVNRVRPGTRADGVEARVPPVHAPAAQSPLDHARAVRAAITEHTADAVTRPRRVSPLFLTLSPAIPPALIALALALRGDYRVATVLGIVQGLGEPLPISSSAHLIITPWLFGWSERNAFYNTQWYDVALHIGTLLAFTAFFWRDWLRLIAAAPQPRSEDGRLFWLLVAASLPGAAIGFVLDRFATDYFRDKHLVIAAALSIMSVSLYAADRRGAQTDALNDINAPKAIAIGFGQSLAFIPGVSRSGATMTLGRALGLKREAAARFSLLMSMPITFGAALLKLKDIDAAAMRAVPFWLGIGVSCVVGVLAIGFLLRYLKRNSFLPFVIYRIGLALLIVAVYVARAKVLHDILRDRRHTKAAWCV